MSADNCSSGGFEYPRAFVVRKKGDLTSQEVFDHIKSQFAPHKWLTGGVYFVESIPRTPSGKVKARDLPRVTTDKPEKL
jgi:acyl-coenzyme A synthetase/AMP-(fatty) acid ligase